MKKIIFTLSLIFLVSCGGNKPKDEVVNDGADVVLIDSVAPKTAGDGHNAQNSLDVDGVYMAELPMATKGTMKVIVTIAGGNYTRLVAVPNAKAAPVTELGTIKWNAEGNTITLEGTKDELPNQYFVGENQLIQLDKDGKRHEGENAASYSLKKQ